MVLLFLVAASFSAAVPEISKPASEATVDAFMKTIGAKLLAFDIPPPPADILDVVVFDEDRLKQLLELNPGRAADVRAAFTAEAQCETSAKETASREAVRGSARQLGEEKLKLLTAFHSGPDYVKLGRLLEKNRQSRTDADEAEFVRIASTYPLKEFRDNLAVAKRHMWSPDALKGFLLDCYEEFWKDFEQRGLSH